jgi:hypothetical protein
MSVVLNALKTWLVLQENGNTPIVHCCWWYCIVRMKLFHVDTIEGVFFYFNMLIKKHILQSNKLVLNNSNVTTFVGVGYGFAYFFMC